METDPMLPGGGGLNPTGAVLDAVTFPIDDSSILTGVAVAGAMGLIAWFACMIGFRVLRKATRRTVGAT